MNAIKLKEKNYWLLKDIGLRGIESRKEVQGNKLIAIYKLIQKKGENIQSTNLVLDGLKALSLGNGEYLAMRKTSVRRGSFYPCAIKTILLTKI